VKKALIVFANGFEEIEAVSVVDILRRVDLDVTVAGLSGQEIKSARNVKVITDRALTEIKEDYDAIIFPGGAAGAKNLSKSEKVKELIIKMNKESKLIAAICASPAIVLAPLGVLKGKKATCYPGMESEFPKDVSFSNERVILDGNIITSRGPGTALLFGLKIVEVLVGKAKAERLQKDMLI